MHSKLAEDFERAGQRESVVGAKHAEYDQLRKVWNGIADRRPAAIVRAQHADDVVRTVQFAAKHGALLAVRCGGHSIPGLSTCDGGIVLDLSAMNQVRVDPVTRTAEVEGGALLGHLDAAGAAHGLATPAGVVSHTGVGGLTLGGGMGWLSRRFGLTIDNLLGVDLVKADGRLIEVNANSDPELFWGIRGGGGNFGVVTKFRFRMHVLGSVLVGQWNYPPDQFENALNAYRERAAETPREVTTTFTLTSTNLSVTAFWSGEGRGAEAMIVPFGELGRPQSHTLGGQSFLELQSRGDAHFAWGRRYYAKGGFLKDMTEDVIDCLVDSIRQSPTPDSELYLTQVGGAIADRNEADTAYSGRAANFYWIVEPVWDEADDDLRCIEWGRQVGKRLSAKSEAGNYVNEQGDSGSEVARSAYGSEKYARLARLKARMDPSNLFRLNQNIEPQSAVPASA